MLRTSSAASKLEPVEENIEIPEGVDVFDTDDDPNIVSIYAMEIFNYMKTREVSWFFFQGSVHTNGTWLNSSYSIIAGKLNKIET